MIFKTIQPPEILKPYVRYYWILNVIDEDLPFSQNLLPYGWMELIFNFKKHTSNTNCSLDSLTHDGFFTGHLETSRQVCYFDAFRSVGVSFQPWAGNLLFKIPANTFTNELTHFSDIDPYSDLRGNLENALSDSETISHIDKYLRQRLIGCKIDSIAAGLSKEVLSNVCNHDKISNIQNGLSRRRVEQRFLSSVGVTLGQYTRNCRFEKSLKLLAEKSSSSLTQIGLDAGYYDQSHFIREFKRFSSFTPSNYRKRIDVMDKTEHQIPVKEVPRSRIVMNNPQLF